MSGTFQSLYYTDCLPGQGLRGGAGFQFQAVSPGVTHEEMTLVQRSALYEAPVSWMREQRAASEYPPSLTHLFDGVYVTARGIYLGAEANGVREGNQFTHAVTTSDVDNYGLVRPAQLWDAGWWSERPAPSTECGTVDAEPEPGPWSVDAIREWVLGRPDAEQWLIAVRSAFEQVRGPNRRRVLFVSDDATAVLGWIAAGTLLLPQARAVQVGFRVFATNPQYSQHDVIALHPDWAGQYANASRNTDFVVFNLKTGDRSPVEPTEAARYWVPQFLRDDPFDVVDAVELAYQFAQSRSAPGAGLAEEGLADRTASSVIVSGHQPANATEARELATWLRQQTQLSIEDVVEPLADAILATQADLATLRELNVAVLRLGPSTELASRTGLALLAAELDGLVRGTASDPGEPHGALHPWCAEDRAAAGSLVERAANAVAPERMDAVLRCATRFGVRPAIGGFTDGAHRFVRWWIDHPKPALDPSRWPGGQHLVDQLTDELRLRLTGAERAAVVQMIREHWWPLLRPSFNDLADPLDAVTVAAAIEQGDPRIRQQTIATVLPVVSRVRTPAELNQVWIALYRFAPPTMDELAEFLRAAPPGPIGGSFAQSAYDILEVAVKTGVSGRKLDLLREVAGRAGTPQSVVLQQMIRQDSDLQRWLEAIRSQTIGSNSGPGAATSAVVAARAPGLISLLLDTPFPVAARAAQKGGRAVHELLADKLPPLWEPSGTGDVAIALAFATGMSETCATEIVARIEREIGKWLKAAGGERAQNVRRILATYDPELVAVWDQARGRKPAEPPATPVTPARPPQPPAELAARRKGWLGRRKDKEGA